MLHALSTADGHELGKSALLRNSKPSMDIPGKGGSLGAPGPVVVGGRLYVGSGYIGTGNGMPGNVCCLRFRPSN